MLVGVNNYLAVFESYCRIEQMDKNIGVNENPSFHCGKKGDKDMEQGKMRKNP